MKIRVSYTTNVGDDYRMALNHSFGECGTLANREDLKRYFERVGSSNDEDLMAEWQDCEDCQRASQGRDR